MSSFFSLLAYLGPTSGILVMGSERSIYLSINGNKEPMIRPNDETTMTTRQTFLCLRKNFILLPFYHFVIK